MKHNQKSQSGFGHILMVLLVVVVLGVIGFAGWRVVKKTKPASTNSAINAAVNASDPTALGKNLSGGKCSGNGSKQLTYAPMKAADIGVIIPMGSVAEGGHVTPIDHEYYYQKNPGAPANTYSVYAPAAGTIVSVQHRTQNVGDQNASGNSSPISQYRIVISYSCTFLSYYDLLTSLDSGVKEGASVTAGQLIGKIGGQSLDFAVWDTTKPLKHLTVPAAYSGEAWKIVTAQPLDYFSDSVKTAILPFYERKVSPRDGIVDQDKDGYATGNWFVAGSGGYSGPEGGGKSPTYYRSHLAIIHDALDPASIIFSIGDFSGQAKFFSVVGNTPDPDTITVSSTPTKYELVKGSYVTADGQGFNGLFATSTAVTVRPQTQVQGVALIQMTGSREMKVEVFPGKTAAQVTGFDGNAKTYNRG